MKIFSAQNYQTLMTPYKIIQKYIINTLLDQPKSKLMGCLSPSPLYSFTHFITIQKQPPKASKKVNVSKFEFQIHPFSESYIRQRIDSQFNPDIDGTQQSFLVSDDGNMKVFESNDQLVTKRDKISACLENALMSKIIGESQVLKQKKCIVFVQPISGKDEYKRILFNIIVETLISLDMSCHSEQRGRLGVYFDWPLYCKGKRESFLLDQVREIHQRNTTMGNNQANI